ncbi:hypothetical protein PG985_015887 [Apiospora marii]|uniref:Uncharacterized protein n=1 Tax=Apiospora marii TaxID=335849 RepID=A0ABR1S5I7_9PEZI
MSAVLVHLDDAASRASLDQTVDLAGLHMDRSQYIIWDLPEEFVYLSKRKLDRRVGQEQAIHLHIRKQHRIRGAESGLDQSFGQSSGRPSTNHTRARESTQQRTGKQGGDLKASARTAVFYPATTHAPPADCLRWQHRDGDDDDAWAVIPTVADGVANGALPG